MSQATIGTPLDASGPLPRALRWQSIALGVWLVVLAVALAINLKTVPLSFRNMADLSDPSIADPEGMRRSLREIGISPRTLAAFATIQFIAGFLLQLVLAALLLRARTVMATLVAIGLVAQSAAQYPPSIPEIYAGEPAWIFLVRLTTVIGMSLFFALPFFFPSGRFVPRWSWIAAPLSVWAVAQFVYLPDLRIGGSLHPVFDAVTTIAFFASALAAQVYRYRRVSSDRERQQTKWVVYGFAIALPGFVIGDAAIRSIGDGSGGVLALLVFVGVMPVMTAALPITLGIAILRHRLFDIDLIINRTLVFLLLSALVVGTYALIVAGVGSLIDARDNFFLSVLAAGLISLGFQPVRQRVQRGVNRLLYGERDEPYGVLSRLGQRLEGTIAPDEILPAIVRTLTESLRLPYAAIILNDGPNPVAATAGTAAPGVTGMLRLPLVYQSEPVGELVIAPRSPGETFGPADRRLLADLARQAGVAAHAVRLTVDLQRARERLVTAREEERRRLRRDLHDGLGSQLSALAIQASTLRAQIERDPEAAAATANELRTELKASVAEIRRLVHGLRPPSLDELGLNGALRERARRFDGPLEGDPAGNRLHVAFEAPADLPDLPAAVEVALYRIMEEALTNVVRHAAATRSSVRLALDDRAVRLSIADDGVGIPVGAAAGIGLGSMRERAAELGGVCTVTPGDHGGTIVQVTLPLSS